MSEADWTAYKEVHDAFADVAAQLTSPRAMIWAHDYHLLLFARAMRQRGHTGPMGHFLHIPFPSLDMFAMLPWAAQLIDAMLDFDLLGFHTPQFVANFAACVSGLLPAKVSDDVVRHRGRETHLAAMPIGIIPDAFQEPPEPSAIEEIEGLMRSLDSAKLVLGVDRLDYTKGIPERLLAFGRMLEMFPEWRGKVSLVQVSVPSRADVPLYAEQRASIESIVGRLNGEFGEATWVPVRYLYRSYGRRQLAQLYRAAAVGYVTPLRDGMNLVAKEYVTVQHARHGSGSLVLSEFTGAAAELGDAVPCNPFDVEGLSQRIEHALRLPVAARRSALAAMALHVRRHDVHRWVAGQLADIAARGAAR
jgi:trehalose-6-phosphate synthase